MHDQREATVRAVFDRLNRGQGSTLGELLTDDAEFDVAYAPEPSPMQNPIVGRDGFQQVFAELVPQLFIDMFMTIDRVILATDPELVVIEYSSTATARPTGQPYSNRYVGIMRVVGGRLAGWKEFHNPERMAQAFGSTSGAPT